MIWNENRFRFVTQSPVGPVGRFLHRSGVRVQATARQIMTVEHIVREGTLRQSIAYEVDNSGPTLRLKVGSNLAYFKWVEFGTQPHPIYPHDRSDGRTPLLHWEPKPNGPKDWRVPGPATARFVNHPGSRPQLMVTRAIHLVLGGPISPRPRFGG